MNSKSHRFLPKKTVAVCSPPSTMHFKTFAESACMGRGGGLDCVRNHLCVVALFLKPCASSSNGAVLTLCTMQWLDSNAKTWNAHYCSHQQIRDDFRFIRLLGLCPCCQPTLWSAATSSHR